VTLKVAGSHVKELDDGAKRATPYQIIKNRGLVAHKSKINRNPRVKKREQFRKATIRRKGQVDFIFMVLQYHYFSFFISLSSPPPRTDPTQPGYFFNANHSNQVRDIRDSAEGANYQGEATGIRTGVSRSRKIYG
jgi:hypothetical protein